MRIDGLTDDQIEMLDKLWTFKTIEEIEDFKKTLSLFHRQQVDTLVLLAGLENIDEMIDKEYPDNQYPDAQILFHKLNIKY